MKRHMKATNILAEDFLQKEMMKANQMFTADTPNELIVQFTQIHIDNQYNKTKAEEKKQYQQRQCQKHITQDNSMQMQTEKTQTY